MKCRECSGNVCKLQMYLHYVAEDTKETYTCLKCGKISPMEFRRKKPLAYGKKEYGTKQLMKLWAWHTFKRHLKKCWGLCNTDKEA